LSKVRRFPHVAAECESNDKESAMAAMPFRIYNTLSRDIEDFKPLKEGKVGLYVCGMTVYDHAHVGHARAMVVFDVFVRYLRHRDWEVNFVRNFTDVDDKIIHRSADTGEEPIELAERFIKAFHEDGDALGLLRPDHEPRVSECIESIQALIGQLIERGNAYVADGTVWFSVETHKSYGKLSGQKVEELRVSADEASGKAAPADFALWKAVKPGEPSWESPWGAGRPGWHIECSAMGAQCLGPHFDIHGGGLDLVFPHHENEIAQSECGNASPYANYWMHNGLLTMSSGQKMGKSLGNVINVRIALEQFPAEALRLYYLQNHYRSPLPWDADALPEALAMLARLYEAREVAEAMGGNENPDAVAESLGQDAQDVLAFGRDFERQFYEALDSDFNTAKMVGFLLRLARAINRFANTKKAKKRGGPVVAPALAGFKLVSDALALMSMDTAAFHAEVKAKRLKAKGLEQSWVDGKIAERSEARESKDWGRADAVRTELDEAGIVVMDTAEGVQWRVRLVAPSEAKG
jgi:cysteinyl-tRNA synthetase